MLTRKQIIATLITTGMTITVITTLNNQIKTQHRQAQEQLQQEAEAYKQCIIQQSETQGYILRHHCSNNYKQLDQINNLTYTQKGYDIYLKKEGK